MLNISFRVNSVDGFMQCLVFMSHGSKSRKGKIT